MKPLSFLPLIILFTGSNCQHLSSPANSEPVVIDSLKLVPYTFDDIKTDTTLFAQPEEVGELDDSSLSESSGLAASSVNPGYFWTHQDSGNSNDIQLIDRQGNIAGMYTLAGTVNRDWEDIAVGPGPIPGESYVYVAEIGDNNLKQRVKTVYRFPEPRLTKQAAPVQQTVTAIDALNIQMPDGPKNAEAILLDPITRDLFVISKEEYTTVYRAAYPQSVIKTTMLELLLVIPLDYMTGASITPDGSELLIRAYDELFYYTRRAGESVGDALKRPPRLIPLAQEAQGEAVCWETATGNNRPGYYTVSEKPKIFDQPVYYYRRK